MPLIVQADSYIFMSPEILKRQCEQVDDFATRFLDAYTAKVDAGYEDYKQASAAATQAFTDLEVAEDIEEYLHQRRYREKNCRVIGDQTHQMAPILKYTKNY